MTVIRKLELVAVLFAALALVGLAMDGARNRHETERLRFLIGCISPYVTKECCEAIWRNSAEPPRSLGQALDGPVPECR